MQQYSYTDKQANTDFIQDISGQALRQAEELLEYVLPGGEREGREYTVKNPTRADNNRGSFKINITTGQWCDFATDDRGGDLVSLVSYIKGCRQSDAASFIADVLNLGGTTGNLGNASIRSSAIKNFQAGLPVPVQFVKKEPREHTDEWRAASYSSTEALPDLRHSKLGLPTHYYLYRDNGGGVRTIVCRFESTTDGKKNKTIRQLSYGTLGGQLGWHWKGPGEILLYKLDEIDGNPNKVIILVEGEKAVEAAQKLFPECLATTTLQGAKSVTKVDFAPLRGRTVIAWPDNDDIGKEYIKKAASALYKVDATVKEIDLSFFGAELPNKWDAADALESGWTAEKILQMQEAGAKLFYELITSESNDLKVSEGIFACDDEWLYYKKPDESIKLASRLEVSAIVHDDDGQNFGKLVEFTNQLGQRRRVVIPMSMTAGDGAEYRKIFLSSGVRYISQRVRDRQLISEYLQTTIPKHSVISVAKTGWYKAKRVFVLPNQTLGSNGPDVMFQSESQSPGLRSSGTLDEWRQNVSALASGNSRLVFAISAAFLGPLLQFINAESGGFHFRGASSIGKTTALTVAASVYSDKTFPLSWRATDNGLEGAAAERNDLCLILDELNEVSPEQIGSIVYMLGNGKGKKRANRYGGSRIPVAWTLSILSTGEISLADHIQSGSKRVFAGQEVRIVDIPADAGMGYGLFEELHDCGSGAILSSILNDASNKYYGTAGIEFIKYLIEAYDDFPVQIAAIVDEFLAEMKADYNPQVKRVLKRFALVGAAGELATSYRITGWKPKEALSAAKMCFHAWLESRGSTGPMEDEQIASHLKHYFAQHGESRFTVIKADNAICEDRTTNNRAGFRKVNSNGEIEYFVFPEVFEREICKGFDVKQAIAVAEKNKWLRLGEDGTRKKCKFRIPNTKESTRMYVISKILVDV